MNVNSGHFLQGKEYAGFDASFFNISPNEAKVVSSSSMELTRLLTDAGDGPKSPDAPGRCLRGSREWYCSLPAYRSIEV